MYGFERYELTDNVIHRSDYGEAVISGSSMVVLQSPDEGGIVAVEACNEDIGELAFTHTGTDDIEGLGVAFDEDEASGCLVEGLRRMCT